MKQQLDFAVANSKQNKEFHWNKIIFSCFFFLTLWYITSHIIYYVCWLLFLNLTLAWIAFANSAYPDNSALFYEALSILATRKNICSQGKGTSLSTLNEKSLSTFNFDPKVNEFLSKIPPISYTFVKHKQNWISNITQSLGVRQKSQCFWKLHSHLNIF